MKSGESTNNASLPRIFLESDIPTQSSRPIPQVASRITTIWTSLPSLLGVEDYLQQGHSTLLRIQLYIEPKFYPRFGFWIPQK